MTLLLIRTLWAKEPWELYFCQKDNWTVTLLTHNVDHGDGYKEGFFDHKAARTHPPSRRLVVCYPLPNGFITKGKK